MIAWLLRADIGVRSWVVLHRVHALDWPFLALSAIADNGALWLVAAAVLALAKRVRWRDVGHLALALVISLTLSDYVLKPLIGRPRPFVASPTVSVIGHRPGDASFPSGHATAAFTSAFVLAHAAPTLSLAWWVSALAVAYSRVYLGVHYPLDVLAGAAIGSAVAALVLMKLGTRD